MVDSSWFLHFLPEFTKGRVAFGKYVICLHVNIGFVGECGSRVGGIIGIDIRCVALDTAFQMKAGA